MNFSFFIFMVMITKFYKKNIIYALALIFIGSSYSSAQTSYIDINAPEGDLVEKLEAQTGNISQHLNSAMKPISRKDLVNFLSDYSRMSKVGKLGENKIEEFNINRAIAISGEWYENASGESGFMASKKPILKKLYRTQTDFLNIETDNFFLVVNPVLYLQTAYGINEGNRITNTRGLELRGRIADKIGFYTMLGDEQAGVHNYVENWINSHNGQFPGSDMAVKRGKNYDIFWGRGYVDFPIYQDKITATFGYDKHHIGYGIRSLVYDYHAAPSSFLKLKGKWQDFDYESLLLEQIDVNNTSGDALRPQKYAAIHTLNYRIGNKFSLGIFESSVYRKDDNTLPWKMFVPVIGLQTLTKGSATARANTAWGLQFKALPLKDIQIYGQAFIDHVNFETIGKGDWKNQYAFQLGLKYYDIAGLNNLDGQIEFNAARPFTYAAPTNGISGFNHYNQPIAHPLGNDYYEWIGNLKYQPTALLSINARAVYSQQGTNPSSLENLGNGVLSTSTTRYLGDNLAYPMLIGDKVNTVLGNLNIAYELRPNIFLEAGGTAIQATKNDISQAKTLIFYGALRMNIARVLYDMY
ncbi:MAG TPA: hypothetical protein PKX92_03255 [Edaphocola sp.]|nr:hypothetical protein [Edaphocola sp.]